MQLPDFTAWSFDDLQRFVRQEQDILRAKNIEVEQRTYVMWQAFYEMERRLWRAPNGGA